MVDHEYWNGGPPASREEDMEYQIYLAHEETVLLRDRYETANSYALDMLPLRYRGCLNKIINTCYVGDARDFIICWDKDKILAAEECSQCHTPPFLADELFGNGGQYLGVECGRVYCEECFLAHIDKDGVELNSINDYIWHFQVSRQQEPKSSFERYFGAEKDLIAINCGCGKVHYNFINIASNEKYERVKPKKSERVKRFDSVKFIVDSLNEK